MDRVHLDLSYVVIQVYLQNVLFHEKASAVNPMLKCCTYGEEIKEGFLV